MKWSLTQLAKYRGSKFDFDVELDMSLLIERTDIRRFDSLTVSGHIEVKQEQYIAQLQINGMFVLPCKRSLEDVLYPVDINTTEYFVLSEDMILDEEHYHLIEGNVLNLEPITEELLLVEKPMAIAKEDAEPLQDGHGYDVISEEALVQSKQEETEDPIDPRLSKLEELFDRDKSE